MINEGIGFCQQCCVFFIGVNFIIMLSQRLQFYLCVIMFAHCSVQYRLELLLLFSCPCGGVYLFFSLAVLLFLFATGFYCALYIHTFILTQVKLWKLRAKSRIDFLGRRLIIFLWQCHLSAFRHGESGMDSDLCQCISSLCQLQVFQHCCTVR